MDKNEAIKQTVNTVGWEIIEEMMEDHFIKKNPIKTEGKSAKEIAREATAREMNTDDLLTFLNKIRGLAGAKSKDKGRYI